MTTRAATTDHEKIANFAHDELTVFATSTRVMGEAIIAALKESTSRLIFLADYFERHPRVAHLMNRRDESSNFPFLSALEDEELPSEIRQKLAVMKVLRASTEVTQAVSALIIRLDVKVYNEFVSEENFQIIQKVKGLCGSLITMAAGMNMRILSQVHAQQHMILKPAYTAIAQHGTQEQFEAALDAIRA